MNIECKLCNYFCKQECFINTDFNKFSKPGIYFITDPEFVGNISLRQDFEVLSADKSSMSPLGWTVKEKIGEMRFGSEKARKAFKHYLNNDKIKFQ